MSSRKNRDKNRIKQQQKKAREHAIRKTRNKEIERKKDLPKFHDNHYVYVLENGEYVAVNTEAETESEMFYSVKEIDDATFFDLITASTFQKSLLDYKGKLFIQNHRQFIDCVKRYTTSMQVTNEHLLSVTVEHPSITQLTRDVGDENV